MSLELWQWEKEISEGEERRIVEWVKMIEATKISTMGCQKMREIMEFLEAIVDRRKDG